MYIYILIITSIYLHIYSALWGHLSQGCSGSQYDAEPRVASRHVALQHVAMCRVVHNFGAHACVQRTSTTPFTRVFGSEYKLYDGSGKGVGDRSRVGTVFAAAMEKEV